MCNTIKATFTRKYARWNEKENRYTDHSQKTDEKLITMEIIFRENTNKAVLRFNGGPTGFESYYIDDLLADRAEDPHDMFCICAGTVNIYALCTVPWQDVKNFLNACGYKSKPADK